MSRPSFPRSARPARHPQPPAVARLGRRAVLLAAAGVLGAPALAQAGAASTVLAIGGSGAAVSTIPALQAALPLAEPAMELRVFPNLGSTGGIAALLAGAIDIAMTARPLDARESQAGARNLAYARTALAFATHHDTPVSSITMADVLRIFAGTLTEWPDGYPIRIVRRPESSGDMRTLAAVSPALAQAIRAMWQRPGLRMAGNSHDSFDALQAIPGSFGVIALTHVLAERRRLTLLTLDGVTPTTAALRAGRYPIVKTFHAVTRADPSPAAVAFRDFLVSAAARPILLALGMEPANAEPVE